MSTVSIALVGVFCAALALASPALAQSTGGGTTAKPAEGSPKSGKGSGGSGGTADADKGKGSSGSGQGGGTSSGGSGGLLTPGTARDAGSGRSTGRRQ